eukprot:gnl/Spiro4/3005_TR1480_c0_g1_i1.p1 gnl/Spiro4/3005_TR1480_c0_g1~~gnl/Spiro4/3005_TR1480_c0_g1_i1.p1  ORF type:complete len:284 (-),score=23.92 gnl/Spiro4/3005_TR1480_c0_g1_i1:21-821(-)
MSLPFLRRNFWIYWTGMAVVIGGACLCYPYAVLTSTYLLSCFLFTLFGIGKPRLQPQNEISPSSSSFLRAARLQSIIFSLFNTLAGDYLVHRVRSSGILYAHETTVPTAVEFLWCFGSPLLVLFVHDTWFYFWHRFLHTQSWLYKHVHSWHHERVAPESWDLFYMHPVEAFLVVMLPHAFCVYLIPTHWLIFEGLLVMTCLIDVYGHIGFAAEPFHPVKLMWYTYLPLPWHRIFLSGRHHDEHHRLKTCNFSLYYNFWDHVLGTGP